jgi:hypothetical protein
MLLVSRVRTIPVQRPILDTIGRVSAPDDADTDTECDVIALCGLTDELSKIFLPCKGLWSSNSVLHQNNRQCINKGERNTRVSKRQCISEVCLPNDIGHGDLI